MCWYQRVEEKNRKKKKEFLKKVFVRFTLRALTGKKIILKSNLGREAVAAKKTAPEKGKNWLLKNKLKPLKKRKTELLIKLFK